MAYSGKAIGALGASRVRNEFEHDILNGKCDVFIIEYDLYTPRPYFYMETKQVQNWTKFDKKDDRLMADLIDCSMGFVGDNFSSPILLINRGSWISKYNPQFHAHIVVDTEEYLAHYDLHKNCIPGWPTRNFKPTRQWVASKNPFDYEQNVRGYPYNTYKYKEIEEIKKIIAEDNGWQDLRQPDAGWRLVFHSSEPHIGFVRKGNAQCSWKEEVNELLRVMDGFVQENGFGCQLFISLTKKPIGRFDEVVHAYVLLAYDDFYKVCPPYKRQDWFNQLQAQA